MNQNRAYAYWRIMYPRIVIIITIDLFILITVFINSKPPLSLITFP